MKRWIVIMDIALIAINLVFVAINAYLGAAWWVMGVSLVSIAIISWALWSYWRAVRRRDRALQVLYREAAREAWDARMRGNGHPL